VGIVRRPCVEVSSICETQQIYVCLFSLTAGKGFPRTEWINASSLLLKLLLLLLLLLSLPIVYLWVEEVQAFYFVGQQYV
jgi:type II secretory pathway component PulL